MATLTKCIWAYEVSIAFPFLKSFFYNLEFWLLYTCVLKCCHLLSDCLTFNVGREYLIVQSKFYKHMSNREKSAGKLPLALMVFILYAFTKINVIFPTPHTTLTKKKKKNLYSESTTFVRMCICCDTEK